MPQLDFAWWIVNFFIIWTTVLIALAIILNSYPSLDLDQSSSTPEMKKTTLTWQWP